MLWFPGQDHQEDCAEAAVPELQALLTARYQGTVSFSLGFSMLLNQYFLFVFAHAFLIPVTEVQTFWDWWRQEGQGNIAFLNVLIAYLDAEVVGGSTTVIGTCHISMFLVVLKADHAMYPNTNPWHLLWVLVDFWLNEVFAARIFIEYVLCFVCFCDGQSSKQFGKFFIARM